jgi:hypothetical protein
LPGVVVVPGEVVVVGITAGVPEFPSLRPGRVTVTGVAE